MSSGLGAIHRTAHGTRTLMDRSMGQYLDGFVFFGPDEVKRLLDEGYPTDAADALKWMFDGGLLLDEPRKRLRWFGGECNLNTWWSHARFMRIAQPQWEGWDMDYAWGDDRGVAAEAGLPVPDRHCSGQSTVSFDDVPCISPWCWYAVLSVRSATGLWVGNAPLEVEGHLARGPAILDARACAEAPLLDLRRADDLPAEGLHVDVTARTVDLYVRPQLRPCYDLDLEDVRAAWAGWTVRDHTRDLAAHPEATPHHAWCEGRIRFPEPNHQRALGDALHSARSVLRWAWQRDPSRARSMQAIFDRALHSEP